MKEIFVGIANSKLFAPMLGRSRNTIFLGACAYAGLSLLSMAAMNIGVLILLVSFLWETKTPIKIFNKIQEECSRPPNRLYLKSTLALIVTCSLSLLVARFFPLKMNQHIQAIDWLKDLGKSWYFFVPILAALCIRSLSEKKRSDVLKVWLFACAILSIVGIIQFFTGWPRMQSIPKFVGKYHAILFIGHHLSVASIWIFPFFAALDLAKWDRRFYLVALLSGTTLVLTFSRMLWGALVIGLALWVVWTLKGKLRWAMVGIFALAGVVLLQFPYVRGRLMDGMGMTERKDLWEANWAFFESRPLTGVGWHLNLPLSGHYLETKYPGGYIFSGHAHNNLLEMLGSTGLLGTFAWVFWCLLVFWLSRRAIFRGLEWAFPRGLCCAWVVFHINGMTQVNFWDSKVLHQIMWVTAWTLVWSSKK